MYTVYLLKSQKKEWCYVGLTDNIERRVTQHNDRRSRATKGFAPFTLVFQRNFSTRPEARDFEKYLKIRSNKEKLLRSLKINAEVVELVDTQS